MLERDLEKIIFTKYSDHTLKIVDTALEQVESKVESEISLLLQVRDKEE